MTLSPSLLPWVPISTASNDSAAVQNIALKPWVTIFPHITGKPLGQPRVMKPSTAAGEWECKFSSPHPHPSFLFQGLKVWQEEDQQQLTGQTSQDDAATPAPGGPSPASQG